jgi:hypothetical protein
MQWHGFPEEWSLRIAALPLRILPGYEVLEIVDTVQS